VPGYNAIEYDKNNKNKKQYNNKVLIVFLETVSF